MFDDKTQNQLENLIGHMICDELNPTTLVE